MSKTDNPAVKAALEVLLEVIQQEKAAGRYEAKAFAVLVVHRLEASVYRHGCLCSGCTNFMVDALNNTRTGFERATAQAVH
jgi:hypothetical protein